MSSGRSFVGWLPVLLLGTACWSQASAAPPVSAGGTRDSQAVERALAAERRVAELEAELRAAESRTSQQAQSAQQRSADTLDRLIAAQSRLEAQVERIEASQQAAAAAPAKRENEKSAPCPAAAALTGGSAPLEQYFLELFERSQIDAPPWRGGLSREKREALRILLRPERRLDASNPLEL